MMEKINYTKIPEEVDNSTFQMVSKDITKLVSVVFWLDYKWVEYGYGTPQLTATVRKQYKAGLYSVTMRITPEALKFADINFNHFFKREIQTAYKRRNKAKDPK